MAGTFTDTDPLTAALNAITLGGGYGGGYGGASTPAITGATIAGFGTGATGGTPSVYTPQFEPGYQNPAVVDPTVTAGVTVPGVTPSAAGFDWKGLFGKDGMDAILGGVQTVGNLWGAWKAQQLAEKQFKFASDFANKNLANQTQSYNTALAGQTEAKYFTEGRSQDAQAYIDANKLRA